MINSRLKIYESYDIAKLTTFRVGGKAQYYCCPASIDDLKIAFDFTVKNNLKRIIIGGGSNLLVSDKGVKGIVISTKKLNKYCIKDNLLISQAGADIDKLCKVSIKKSLSGLEFAGGLPGSIGGAVYMNARAYGSNIGDVVLSVDAIKDNGKIIKLENADMNFSYKDSIFMHDKDLFIYNIVLSLKKADKSKIKKIYNTNKKDRITKGQFKYPSAGCVFKNDYSINLIVGKLIDELGLKGKKIGNAMIYPKHGNFIINTGNAKAEDIKALIEMVEDKVLKEKGIKLQREIRLLGF